MPELPAEDPDQDLKFAEPNTTGELMKDEDKKTVTGPAPINPPEPPVDSAIDVKPTPAPEE